ncbi:deaminase domain-containing protein [Paenibacillus curdlanolyticus]|nr:deaminase domain-containing protein [Paenibacillus curdlanolyticus]
MKLDVDARNTYVNTVNTQIMEAKKNYWAYTDLANTTADAASTNDYNKLAASQQAIYLGLQKDAAGVEGIIKTTAVDTLNTNFLTARNALNGYLKNAQFDKAMNALDYMQELKNQGATLNIRRNSTLAQSKVDEFLYELKSREWARKENLLAPDASLDKYKVIAKNVLCANGLVDRIVNLDKWNELNLKAKSDYWRGAANMDLNAMHTAAAALNSADMKKYSSLTNTLTTKLDRINQDIIRLIVNDTVYKGDEQAEYEQEAEYEQLDQEIQSAKKAGMGSSIIANVEQSKLASTMNSLYEEKKSIWDMEASGVPASMMASLEASKNSHLAAVKNLYASLQSRPGGEQFVLPAFSMDAANNRVLALRQQLHSAVTDADPDKAWALFNQAEDLLYEGATLDIHDLEPNLARTDWGQIRIDKMFRETIDRLNRETSTEDIKLMQKYMKKIGFYDGEQTGVYDKEFLTDYGMYQYIIVNNSLYNLPMFGRDLQVDGSITKEWLHIAASDVDKGAKVEWADSPEGATPWGFKTAYLTVGVLDGAVGQLIKDGIDTANFISSINVTSPKYYTETIPAIYSFAKAIVKGDITWEDIKDSFTGSMREQFVTPFQDIKNNYQKIVNGTASYEEAREFGRDVMTAMEAVSVVIGIGIPEKAAQLAGKLGLIVGELAKVSGRAAIDGLGWLRGITREAAEKVKGALQKRLGGAGVGKLSTRVLDEAVDATLISRVKNIRNSLPSDLKRSGNVGLAEVEIPGLKKEFYAHSGIDVLSDARSAASAVSDISLKPTNPIFKASTDSTIDGRDLLRDIDTEYKILNDVASQLGNKFDQKGKLTLFTEKPPCASCSNVIEEFMARYKNITVEVVHNNHQRILP